MSEIREIIGLTVESVSDDSKTIGFRDGSEIRVNKKGNVDYVNAFAVVQEAAGLVNGELQTQKA